MEALLMPFAVFGSFVLVVGPIPRLLSDISLNRTIREAMRADPASVPLLASRLGARQPWSDSLIGWIFIALAAGIVLISLFEPADERRDMLQAAIVPLVIGVVVIAYVRRAMAAANTGNAAHDRPPPPPVRVPSRPRKSSPPATTREG